MEWESHVMEQQEWVLCRRVNFLREKGRRKSKEHRRPFARLKGRQFTRSASVFSMPDLGAGIEPDLGLDQLSLDQLSLQ